MIISVKLVCHQVRLTELLNSMLMIPCGMDKVAVQLAHAAYSTTHPWFCKQLPQMTNADLEVRLCSDGPADHEMILQLRSTQSRLVQCVS